MFQLYEELQCLRDEGRSIRVGLVGAGFMGRGIVEVVEDIPGMEVVAIADREVERACECIDHIQFKRYRVIEKVDEAKGVDISSERVVTRNPRVIPEIEKLDFIIEATGDPVAGAEVAFFSIMNGKHVGMLNVETDSVAGYYLSSLARKMGVVYTVCSGDEPVAVKELYDFARTCGFKVVAAGKGKNNPLDIKATPETLREKASSMGLHPARLTEFVDGTKTMVEMCCVANSSGLTIDVRNMHGPHAGLEELPCVFRLREHGGILTREGIVDYAIGNVAPGVFVVVRHEGRIANETLKYLKIGEGPDYLLYRPYHLTSLEVPRTIALAYLYGRPMLAASSLRTEVITIAKRDLKAGDYIDGFGGFCVYGGIEQHERAKNEKLLPMGLATGARLKEDIAEGSVIRYDQVEVVDSLLYQFWKIQERLNG
ncbi:MAG: NAD(P)H-dependent oxidoreductase [Spirochaetota bacterium]